MRTHREFFEDMVGPMADIAFVGCCVTDAAEPPLPSGGATPMPPLSKISRTCSNALTFKRSASSIITKVVGSAICWLS
jgi:hypothetical protein